jgi:integrase
MKPRTNEAQWIAAVGRWQINVQRDGRRRTFASRTPGSKGKIEAEKKADRWIEEGNAKDIRFQKAWEGFIADQKARTGTGNWKQRETIGRKWLLPSMKHRRISSITNQHWQDIINKAHQAGLSKKSQSNIRGCIYAFYKYVRKRRIAMIQPEDIVIPADAPVGVRKVLQPDQVKTLFSHDKVMRYEKEIPAWFIHAWRFQVLAGPRPGEVYGLIKATDIDDTYLRIRRSINRYGEETGGKNERARRQMKLTSRMKLVLDAQSKMLQLAGIKSDWVFPDEDGKRADPSMSYKQWCVYRKQHGITCSLEELRHSTVSLAKSELPEPLMKMLLGHGNDMDTFGVYGHEIEGDLQRAADILERIFDKILE